MKAHFEHVTVRPGESWSLQSKDFRQVPFLWHYHPEFELTLLSNGHGHRYVGDSIERFEANDLVLVGPNQPHTWHSAGRFDPQAPIRSTVAWFTADWLDTLMATWPEMLPLQKLRAGAGRGLRFSRKAVEEVEPLMRSLRGLDAPDRLPRLLQILVRLARDRGMRPLASHAITAPADGSQRRLSTVLHRIHADLHHPPSAPELATLAALSVGAFHRWFKRHSGLTLGQYIMQLRVGTACQLLISSDRPIGTVAAAAGFGTLAHFNRQFLRSKGMTPSRFRAAYRP